MRRLGILSVVAAFFVSGSAAFAADRLVPSQYPTIQAAIDAAWHFSTVIVAPGIYTGPGNRDLDFRGKWITVRSVDPNDPCVVAATIIDCNGSEADPHRGFNFHSGEYANSVVDGLTITNGRASSHGGGIYCSGASPTIKNCIITGNRTTAGRDGEFQGGNATNGGGIYLLNSNAEIVNCSISNNQTGRGGHGYGLWDPPQSGNGGDGGHGGGIYCSNSFPFPAIKDCTITNNRTGNGGDGYPDPYGTTLGNGGDAGHGAGIYCSNLSALTIVNTNISGNVTGSGGDPWDNSGWGGDGGGICCLDSSLSLEATTVTNNTAGTGQPPPSQCGSGGGLFCYNSTATLFNCKITNNYSLPEGAGMRCYVTTPVITGSTLSGNQSIDCGLFFWSGATISNCIIWNNGSGEITGSATVTYSDIRGSWPGAGNIDADPCFVSGPLGSYYLKQTAAGQAVDSPCVDAGGLLASHLGMDVLTTRTDGVGDMGVVDMGYHHPIPISSFTCWDTYECAGQTEGDATCDGNVDLADVFALKTGFGESGPWIPPVCCADFNHDDSVNLGDLFILKAGFGSSGYSPSTGNQNCPP